MDCKSVFVVFLALALTLATFTDASDPDILTDFVARPGGREAVNASLFTYTGMRSLFQEQNPPATFTVTKATVAEFPALNGQSVSYTVLQYPSGTVNPPHTHPRAAELLFLTHGSLEVGFVDTAGKLFPPDAAGWRHLRVPQGAGALPVQPQPEGHGPGGLRLRQRQCRHCLRAHERVCLRDPRHGLGQVVQDRRTDHSDAQSRPRPSIQIIYICVLACENGIT